MARTKIEFNVETGEKAEVPFTPAEEAAADAALVVSAQRALVPTEQDKLCRFLGSKFSMTEAEVKAAIAAQGK